jgi:uncharacterized membrane protein
MRSAVGELGMATMSFATAAASARADSRDWWSITPPGLIGGLICGGVLLGTVLGPLVGIVGAVVGALGGALVDRARSKRAAA